MRQYFVGQSSKLPLYTPLIQSLTLTIQHGFLPLRYNRKMKPLCIGVPSALKSSTATNPQARSQIILRRYSSIAAPGSNPCEHPTTFRLLIYLDSRYFTSRLKSSATVEVHLTCGFSLAQFISLAYAADRQGVPKLKLLSYLCQLHAGIFQEPNESVL